jgi:hypothetical protein
MRRLTPEQQDQIYDALKNDAGFVYPYVNATDLDDICLDGWFSLLALQKLVTLLTAFSEEEPKE